MRSPTTPPAPQAPRPFSRAASWRAFADSNTCSLPPPRLHCRHPARPSSLHRAGRSPAQTCVRTFTPTTPSLRDTPPRAGGELFCPPTTPLATQARFLPPPRNLQPPARPVALHRVGRGGVARIVTGWLKAIGDRDFLHRTGRSARILRGTAPRRAAARCPVATLITSKTRKILLY